MRIGIDVRPLCPPRTGIGNYVYGLVRQLPTIAPENQYHLYSNRETTPVSCGQSLITHRERAFKRLPGTAWLLARGGSLARRDQLDVFWATSAVLPRNLPRRVHKVITIYDMVWRLFPETMTRRALLIHRSLAEGAIHRADLIIVISETTREDLVRHFRVPSRKIKLVYPGINTDEYEPLNPTQSAAYISSNYSCSPRYVAAVGTIEPRKNLALLVRVLQLLKARGQLDCQLLIAGASGWKNSALFDDIQRAGLTENEIRFLGYIPQGDMPRFYAGAQLFLFPSWYEGFGFPPLEAMACGVPVVASNSRCMPEVLGSAAALRDATDAEGFADSVTQLLGDEGLRQRLRLAGFQQVRKFSWSKAADQLLSVLGIPLPATEAIGCV